jgi:hypothetical protein
MGESASFLVSEYLRSTIEQNGWNYTLLGCVGSARDEEGVFQISRTNNLRNLVALTAETT